MTKKTSRKIKKYLRQRQKNWKKWVWNWNKKYENKKIKGDE